MAPQGKKSLSLRIDPDLLRRVDETRGDIPRTRFIERALEARLPKLSPEEFKKLSAEQEQTFQETAAEIAEKHGPSKPMTEEAFRELLGPQHVVKSERPYHCPNCPDWEGCGSPNMRCPNCRKQVVPNS